MARHSVVLRSESGAEYEAVFSTDGAVTIDGRTVPVRQLRPGEIRAGDRTAWIAVDGDTRWVFLEGQVYTFATAQAGSPARSARRHHPGGLSAPMPATVVAISVSPGDRVRAGDPLIVLEAMKMELPVRAPADGTVSAVRCRVGELVQPGQDLVELESA